MSAFDPLARGLAAQARAAAAANALGLAAANATGAALGRRESFGQLYYRLVARRHAAMVRNVRGSGLYAGLGATPTMSATAPNATTTPLVPATNNAAAYFQPYFAVAGGWTAYSGNYIFPLVATKALAQTATGGSAAVALQTAGRIIFLSTAAQLSIKLLQTQAAPVRIIIDGQYTDATGYTPSAVNTASYLTLSFPARAPQGRRIEVEVQGGSNVAIGITEFGGVYQSAADAIWAPSSLGPRVWVGGDSITFGVANANLADGHARVVGDLLGIDDLWQSGIGGTGYVVRGSSGTTASLHDRLFDLTGSGCDLAILRMGINDVLNDGASFGGITVSPAGVQATLLADLQTIRAARPNLPLILFGPFRKVSATFRTLAPSYETAVQAAIAAMADPLIAFVPTLAANPPLQTGTGYAGATTGDGNSDWGITTDQTHPTTDGHRMIAQRAAEDVMTALKGMATALGLTAS